jgi:HPt (histidine-containing phosphotransfer) domain-containing protein
MSKIDYDTFNKLKERMKAKFPTLLEGYLRDSKSYLATIEGNLSDGDLGALIDASHSMKSASGLVGIMHAHNAAETLEYAGKALQEGDFASHESLRSNYEALQNAFFEIEDELQNELSKLKQA